MLLKHTLNGCLCEVDDELGEQLIEGGSFVLEDIPPGSSNPVLWTDDPKPTPEIPVLSDDEPEADTEPEDPQE